MVSTILACASEWVRDLGELVSIHIEVHKTARVVVATKVATRDHPLPIPAILCVHFCRQGRSVSGAQGGAGQRQLMSGLARENARAR